ncbi:unnamed protein product, partial [Prorocentrum cordatum]
MWTGISSSWVADSRCEGEAFGRVVNDVELGTRVRAPPVRECWGDIARRRKAARWRWEKKGHINLLEMRAGVAAARHSARNRASWGKRHLRITDSMVCLGGFSKGRSSSRPILILCRGMAALDLGRGARECWRRAPSDRNRSDGPSWGPPIGQAPKERETDQQVMPEEVALKIEALADVAELDPFQPLRTGASVPVKGRAAAGPPAALRRKFDLTDVVNVGGLELLAEMETDGGPMSVERPADPGCAPSPPIYIAKELMDWEAEVAACRVTFPQCMRGCPALKMTAPTGAACATQRFERPCEHLRRGASLCGKDASGRFRARASQAHPSEFCRMLAECRADATLATQERREADLAERALEQLISETLDRRRRGLSSLVALPTSFFVAAARSSQPPLGPMEPSQRARARAEEVRGQMLAGGEYCLFVGRVSRGPQAPSACARVRRSWRCEAGRARGAWALRCVLGLAGARDLDGAANAGLALPPFSVSTATALSCYMHNARRFLGLALERHLPMMSREEIDVSVLCYLDCLEEDEEVGPHVRIGVTMWCTVSPSRGQSCPRDCRGQIEPYAPGVDYARQEKVALDPYHRSAEPLGPRAADVAVDVDAAGEQVAALRRGAPKRGERTKTGTRQGAPIVHAHAAGMLARRACDDVGVERFPPHAARHSGPSHDAATGHRAARAIQRRGRWASEMSVLRHMKTYAMVAACAAPPSDAIERGASLTMKKGARALT